MKNYRNNNQKRIEIVDARDILSAQRKQGYSNPRVNNFDLRNKLTNRNNRVDFKANVGFTNPNIRQNTNNDVNFTIPKKTIKNEFFSQKFNTNSDTLQINTSKKVSGDVFSNPKVSVGMFANLPEPKSTNYHVNKFDPSVIKRINEHASAPQPIKRKSTENMTFVVENPTFVENPRPSVPPAKKPALTTATLPNRQANNSLVSPIQGYRIEVKNLHSEVTVDDIFELFTSLGGELRSCNLVRPGFGEVVFRKLTDANKAIEEYHGRELDKKPMNVKLVTPAVESTNNVSENVNITNKIASIQMFRKPSMVAGKVAEVDKDTVFRSMFSKSKEIQKAEKKPFKFSVTL